MKNIKYLSLVLAAGLLISFLLAANAVFSGTGGKGIYLEFKMTSKSVTGNVKTYYLDGDTRTEMDMNVPSQSGSPTAMVTLVKKETPNTVYMLNEADKTYTEISAGKKEAENSKPDEYEITVLGKEKVNNYNCTHVKILYKNSKRQTEMWTSTDIIDYDFFKNVKNKYLEGSDLFKALDEKGAKGFAVRLITSEGREGQVQMDLVKAEKKDIDSKIFSLDGYKKSAALNPKEMMKQMQNMTPEERQKYMEQMKNQFSKPK